MVAIPEVPNISHTDIQSIFRDMDIMLNPIFLEAFCTGMTFTTVSLQPILNWILNRILYWDYCYYNVDHLFVTLLLNMNSH